MSRIRAGVLALGTLAIVASGALVVASSTAAAERGRHHVETASADLTGFAEVPSKLTNGHGTFNAVINERASRIDYKLTFTKLSTPVTASHIHFGQRGVAAGITIFLCGGGGKPVCPPGGGTVTGTITPANVLALSTPGPTDQGIAAGDFAGALRILRSGFATSTSTAPASSPGRSGGRST